MKMSHLSTLGLGLLGLLLSTSLSFGQEAKGNSSSPEAAVEIIQFHSENRCHTCKQIEKLTRATLEKYSNINFSLVNVDRSENEAQAEAFKASGTALFLHNPQTGAKKNLTQFAFMNAGNEATFKEKLREHIQEFSR